MARHANSRWTGSVFRGIKESVSGLAERPWSTQGRGYYPAAFVSRGRNVRELSIFIDESGDFRPLRAACPVTTSSRSCSTTRRSPSPRRSTTSRGTSSSRGSRPSTPCTRGPLIRRRGRLFLARPQRPQEALPRALQLHAPRPRRVQDLRLPQARVRRPRRARLAHVARHRCLRPREPGHVPVLRAHRRLLRRRPEGDHQPHQHRAQHAAGGRGAPRAPVGLPALPGGPT